MRDLEREIIDEEQFYEPMQYSKDDLTNYSAFEQ